MRAGGCTVQQALTNEAANVVKQAVTLARRRGHAQVTPLHVANTMLSASTGLLRTACIQSHSHPLQCRALELCFNVALNRLPASSSSPMLGGHSQYPSISNALVAAFKRAQAHQRRGSIENQQQPLLAVKIELEQLIISILDDPSVSRVMREAGFSSTQVKSNVEQAVSLEICSQNAPSANSKSKENSNNGSNNLVLSQSPASTVAQVGSNKVGKPKGSDPIIRNEDVMFVIENLMNQKRRNFVVVVEHMIMELGKLVCNFGEINGRFRIMGIATFQTYMRCKSGHPSLETVLGLHPLTIPAGSLRLSLIADSDIQSQSTSKKVENGSSSWIFVDGGDEENKQQLTCCADCSARFESEVRNLQSSSTCNSESTTSFDKNVEPTGLRLYIPEHSHKDPKQLLSSNPNSTPNSASSSDVMEMEYVHKFKELNAENLTTLCTALEKKVPWQKEAISEIVSTILKCRSGMLRRKGKLRDGTSKEETWLFFQGVDVQAKEKIAKELARLVFGSQSNFVTIALSSFSSTRADSTEDSRNKRSRDEQSCSYIDRFAEAVSSNPHRVFFIEDVEQADYCSQMGFKRAMERGRIANANGEEAILGDAIIILSCESFSSRSRACSPPTKQKSDEEEKVAALEETSPCVSLDLNISIDDDDDDRVEEQSIDDIGLLESVDRRIIFKIQEL
ncbi:hypothetical protein COLO4_29594 [Corchorus olitorius]|uniref:Clp R domain-containing protein n=1 Tax=Corchorus olitorius TaxID=93759 RepID=A0A1R3HE00_9ROSI|nr:hypothetical protein COLO4_29594 [Corchorus olitorius]